MINDALKDYEWLVQNDLVKMSFNRIVPTERGSEILKEVDELLDLNRNVLKYINQMVREPALDTGQIIKEIVYSLPILGEKRRIEKATKGETLLSGLTDEEAISRFLIDDEWLETLSILMDKEFFDSLNKGIKDVQEGRIKRYNRPRKLDDIFSVYMCFLYPTVNIMMSSHP